MKKKRATRSRHTQETTTHLRSNLSFSAHDAHSHRKNSLWYLGIGILLLAVLAALWQAGEYLLMAVAVAVALAVFRLADVGAREKDVELSDRGVTFSDEFWPYFELRAFWVAEHNETASVYIERLNWLPAVHFVVPTEQAERVALFLADHLPWHDHRSEPLGDRLGRLLRF